MSTAPELGNASDSVSASETGGAVHSVVSLAGQSTTVYPSVFGEHVEEASPTPTTSALLSAPAATDARTDDVVTVDPDEDEA